MNIKEFLSRVGILLLYLVTLPFIILFKDFKLLLRKSIKAEKPKFLHKLFLFLFLVYWLIVKNHGYAYTFLICTIISILKYQWDSGTYMAWWKQRKVKRLKKKYPNLIKKNE